MFFGELNGNQYSGDTLHPKERMGPPLYYQSQTLPRSLHGQKKSQHWVSRRPFRTPVHHGDQGHMSPAPSECESDDSGRSSTTSSSTTTYDKGTYSNLQFYKLFRPVFCQFDYILFRVSQVLGIYCVIWLHYLQYFCNWQGTYNIGHFGKNNPPVLVCSVTNNLLPLLRQLMLCDSWWFRSVKIVKL